MHVAGCIVVSSYCTKSIQDETSVYNMLPDPWFTLDIVTMDCFWWGAGTNQGEYSIFVFAKCGPVAQNCEILDAALYWNAHGRDVKLHPSIQRFEIWEFFKFKN